jgi:hypothetical protein
VLRAVPAARPSLGVPRAVRPSLPSSRSTIKTQFWTLDKAGGEIVLVACSVLKTAGEPATGAAKYSRQIGQEGAFSGGPVDLG